MRRVLIVSLLSVCCCNAACEDEKKDTCATEVGPAGGVVEGPDGIVLHKHLGPLSPQAWQRDFVPLLNGGSS